MARTDGVYFALRNGMKPGIYPTWPAVRQQLYGLNGIEPDYGKFNTVENAQAFLSNSGNAVLRPSTLANKVPQIAVRATHHHHQNPSQYATKRGTSVKQQLLYTSWKNPVNAKKSSNSGTQRPIHRQFSTNAPKQAWLKPSIPRGSQVSPLLPESLRWDGIQSLLEPRRPHGYPGQQSTGSASSLINNAQNGNSLILRLEQIRAQGFLTTGDGALVVYTDGSAKKVVHLEGPVPRAGCGVWWGSEGNAHTFRLSERIPGQSQTSTRAELVAIIRALETCPFPNVPLEIRTDSLSCISYVHDFLPKWLRRGAPDRGSGCSNDRDLIIHLLALSSQREQANGVRFAYVRAHQGEPGNEGADRLAGQGTKLPAVPDRQWLTMEDLRRYRHWRALRLALDDDAAAGRKGPVLTVDAEMLEVEEMLDTDADSDADLNLSLEQEEALENEGFVVICEPHSSLLLCDPPRPTQNGTIPVATTQSMFDSAHGRQTFVRAESPEFELLEFVDHHAKEWFRAGPSNRSLQRNVPVSEVAASNFCEV